MDKTITMVKKPEHVGRYKLGDIISDKGGFGIVYKTVHPEFKKEYAIKVFRNDRVNGKQMLQKREILKIAELSEHDNIVNEIDAGEDNGKYFIVMEIMDGSLSDWLGKIPLEKTEWVFREVAKGLKHIHDNDHIHQDIKPSNILLRYDNEGKINQVKITDFGLAVSLNEEGSKFLIGGTKGYQAPEVVLQGKKPTSASDIYSLGVTFYHVLTGQKPDNFEQSIPPSKLRKGVPKKLNRLILRMLDRKANEEEPKTRKMRGRETERLHNT